MGTAASVLLALIVKMYRVDEKYATNPTGSTISSETLYFVDCESAD